MEARRFYTPLQQLKPGIRIYLPEDESIHLTKTLRKKQGDKIEVFNGSAVFSAEIYTASRKSVRVKLLEKIASTNRESLTVVGIPITVYLGMVKLPRFEFAVQKLTELGVAKIIPLKTEYANVPEIIFEKKHERIERIVIEACKQSKSLIVPELAKPQIFDTMVASLEQNVANVILSTETSEGELGNINFEGEVQNINLVIGPEGGFSPDEIEKLKENSHNKFVSFGPAILRTETAAIAALAVLQSRFNNY